MGCVLSLSPEQWTAVELSLRIAVVATLVSLPFGLSLPGLVAQLFKTAAGYPYLSVNAYNPWALVAQDGHGVAADRSWVCDSTVVPTGPSEFHLGPFTIPEWGSAGSSIAMSGSTFFIGRPRSLLA